MLKLFIIYLFNSTLYLSYSYRYLETSAITLPIVDLQIGMVSYQSETTSFHPKNFCFKCQRGRCFCCFSVTTTCLKIMSTCWKIKWVGKSSNEIHTWQKLISLEIYEDFYDWKFVVFEYFRFLADCQIIAHLSLSCFNFGTKAGSLVEYYKSLNEKLFQYVSILKESIPLTGNHWNYFAKFISYTRFKVTTYYKLLINVIVLF